MENRLEVDQIKEDFYRINRFLTLGLLGVIILASILFWRTGIASIEKYSIWIGLIFMGLAILFYKLPHISYLILRRRSTALNSAECANLCSGWNSFKTWLEAQIQ